MSKTGQKTETNGDLGYRVNGGEFNPSIRIRTKTKNEGLPSRPAIRDMNKRPTVLTSQQIQIPRRSLVQETKHPPYHRREKREPSKMPVNRP